MGLESQENDHGVKRILVRLKVLLLPKYITQIGLLFQKQCGPVLIRSGQRSASSSYVILLASFMSTSHKLVSLERGGSLK